MKDLRKQNCDLSTAGIELGGFPFCKTARYRSVCVEGVGRSLYYIALWVENLLFFFYLTTSTALINWPVNSRRWIETMKYCAGQ